MVTKFKTLITPNGEFGVFEMLKHEVMKVEHLFLATSSKPHLYDTDITIDKLKKHFNGTTLYGSIEIFDWDEHIGDWELVEVSLTIKEEK